jgi:phenylacetate-coenzyme A ligase PaaK-like adenylate-forming protein
MICLSSWVNVFQVESVLMQVEGVEHYQLIVDRETIFTLSAGEVTRRFFLTRVEQLERLEKRIEKEIKSCLESPAVQAGGKDYPAQ